MDWALNRPLPTIHFAGGVIALPLVSRCGCFAPRSLLERIGGLLYSVYRLLASWGPCFPLSPCWGYGESTKMTESTMTTTEHNPQSSPDRQSIAEPFTYWRESDGRFLGYLNAYPDHWTQGDDLEDLKAQLLDLYQEFSKEDLPGIRRIGELVVA